MATAINSRTALSGRSRKTSASPRESRIARRSFSSIIGQEVNELHAILSLVASGQGVSLFPASVTRLTLRDLIYRPIHPSETPMAELVLAWREGQETSTARRFIEMAKLSGT